jgi:amidohydrolase
MRVYKLYFGIALLLPLSGTVSTQTIAEQRSQVEQISDRIEPQVIIWRRDIHQNPELGNREFRTSKLVADHLHSLGLEVKTGVAHTGVVGLLRCGKPGRVVALRADMDALPVTEQTGLPYASKVKATWMGQEVGVMHACGHDGHTAILMGVAEILAEMKANLSGTVKFIFQPAEELPPLGEEGGAQLMIKEGVLNDPIPEAIFSLHLTSRELGRAGYRAGLLMASGDQLKIVVKGKQSHGALPWLGIDPIVIASQIVLGLQTIQSRQVKVLVEPSVITIGAINGGNRSNIIPESVEMIGTIRTFNEEMRNDIHRRIVNTAQSIARSAEGSAVVTITREYDVTTNDTILAERAVKSLCQTLGEDNVFEISKTTSAEDFSAYQKVIPGFFFFLGAIPKKTPPEKVFPNHSPQFWIDESVLKVGVKAMSNLALDFLAGR